METDDNNGNEEISMITKLVSNDNNNNSFKFLLYYVFVEDIKYMTILTRQERERLVLDLYYNQGKTYREISKELRISPHDIGFILNKAVEEKEESRRRNKTRRLYWEKTRTRTSPSISTYPSIQTFFWKTPLEVATELNLRESEAIKFYKEH